MHIIEESPPAISFKCLKNKTKISAVGPVLSLAHAYGSFDGPSTYRYSSLLIFLELVKSLLYEPMHGLRTPNEGINQRYLKNWADVADKIYFGRT